MKQEEEECGDKKEAAVGSVLRQQRSFGSSSVASFEFFFTVSSKSPVPEGDFERSDLPLFSGFVPGAHAVGWNLKGTRHVGESGFVAIFMPCGGGICISETSEFVIISYTSENTVYFKTLITSNEAISVQHLTSLWVLFLMSVNSGS